MRVVALGAIPKQTKTRGTIKTSKHDYILYPVLKAFAFKNPLKVSGHPWPDFYCNNCEGNRFIRV